MVSIGLILDHGSITLPKRKLGNNNCQRQTFDNERRCISLRFGLSVGLGTEPPIRLWEARRLINENIIGLILSPERNRPLVRLNIERNASSGFVNICWIIPVLIAVNLIL